jgi:DNA transposition AAA+ family ATPase
MHAFVETGEHHRFEEFCEACRRDRYIGLCYGPPGVGKTISARRLTRADEFEALRSPLRDDPEALQPLSGVRTLLYTPDVINGPRAVSDRVLGLWNRLLFIEAAHLSRAEQRPAPAEDEKVRLIIGTQSRTVRDANRKLAGIAAVTRPRPFLHPLELLIVDEADRLKTASLEQLRHLFDRGEFGLVLIGMPGLEKRLARYPQFYSRVGFVHAYRPLRTDELRRILLTQAGQLVEALPDAALADPEAVAAVLRVAGGNLRLVVRLLTQTIRILAINGLRSITPDVVVTARESLVIGAD